MSHAQLPAAAALTAVPGVRAGIAPLRIERLLGGSVNDSWRVDTSEGRFVLRLDGPAWRRPGVDREREQALHAAAARAGLAPRVLREDSAMGVRVCEYLEGRSWEPADFLQPLQLRRLGRRLAELHALPVPAGVEAFDPGACARSYFTQRAGSGADAEMTALAAGIDAAASRVASGTRRLSIVHGDLAHANVLDGARLWLLDWEYAQVADPLYDVACILAYYPQARPNAAALLQAAGLEETELAERLPAAVSVYSGLSDLWHMVRRGSAPS